MSIAQTHPDVAKLWHDTKNGDLTPSDFTKTSKKSVWWKCTTGNLEHDDMTAISNMVRRKRKCLFCPGKKLCSENSLAMVRSQLIKKRWHFEKNFDIDPYQIALSTSASAWWKCENSEFHDDLINISSVIRNNNKCDYCKFLKVCIDNCLRVTHFDIAKIWCNSKNDSLTPNDVTHMSTETVWWMCPQNKDHDHQLKINVKAKGQGCPFCSGKKINHTNSLAGLCPQIAKEWHPTKNGISTPNDVTCGSDKVIWWKCVVNTNHVWDMTVYKRARRKQNCPYCASVRIDESNCLKTVNSKIAKEFHPTKNGNSTSSNVGAGSKLKVWWKCKTGDPEHEWKCCVIQRTKKNGTGCPFCAGQRVCSSNCLSTTHPTLTKEWHPTSNGKLTPQDVTHGTSRAVWWKCKKCGEKWKAMISNRSTSDGCPFCKNKRVSKHNNLQAMFPDIAKEWHPKKNGNLLPTQVVSGSSFVVWWKCTTGHPEHEWKLRVCDRTSTKPKCPFCCYGRLCSTNCLSATHPNLVVEWHPTKNGNITVRDVSYGQAIKIWWKCKKCKFEWNASLNARSQGSGCPKCSKKNYSIGSLKWLNIIQQQKQTNIQHVLNGGELKIKINGFKRGAYVDGYCKNANTVYEYLGCMYHGHPPKECVDRQKYYPKNLHPLNKKTYKELYDNTIKRLELIKEKGYKIVIIWECKFLQSLKRKKKRDLFVHDDIIDLDDFMYS